MSNRNNEWRQMTHLQCTWDLKCINLIQFIVQCNNSYFDSPFHTHMKVWKRHTKENFRMVEYTEPGFYNKAHWNFKDRKKHSLPPPSLLHRCNFAVVSLLTFSHTGSLPRLLSTKIRTWKGWEALVFMYTSLIISEMKEWIPTPAAFKN